MKKYLLYILGFLFFASVGFASALVPTRFEQNILPFLNNTYELGSSSPARNWLAVYTQKLFLATTTAGCQTISATGESYSTGSACGTGSGGGGNPFTNPTLDSFATTSGAVINNASSTIVGNLLITGNSTTTNATSTNFFATLLNGSIGTFNSFNATSTSATSSVAFGLISKFASFWNGLEISSFFATSTATSTAVGGITASKFGATATSSFNGLQLTGGCYATSNGTCISTSGGSGYATIQDETTPLTQRTTVNFTGAGVSCADNGGTSVTDCTIAGAVANAAGNTGEVQFNIAGALAANSGFFWDSTNNRLGIGTTSPLAILSVSATSTNSTTPLFVVATSTNSSTGATVSTTTAFIIDRFGNVGIGTSSPSRVLSVQAATNNSALIVRNTTNGGTGGFTRNLSLSGTSPCLILYASGSNKSSTLCNNADGSVFFGPNITGDDTLAAGSNRMVFHATGDLSMGGNTGAFPTDRVQLNVSARSTQTTVTSSAVPDLSAVFQGPSTSVGQIGGIVLSGYQNFGQVALTARTDSGGGNTSGDFSIWTRKVNTDTAFTEQLTLLHSNGNVGIGTTTPWAKLSVAGVPADNVTPLFTVATSTTANATTSVFIIDRNGSAGIGTSSPISTLSVVGNNASSTLWLGSVARPSCFTWFSVPSGNPFREYINDAGTKVIEAGVCTGN